jgi:hypothetical protein
LLIELFGFGVISANEVFFLPIGEHKTQKINVKQNRHSGKIKHTNKNLADAFCILQTRVKLRSSQFLVHFYLKHFPLTRTSSKINYNKLAAFIEREHDYFN